MKATKESTAPTTERKAFKLSSLVDELHDRVGEALALLGAVSGVAGSTDITRTSLDRLRHVLIAAEGALGEVQDIGNELRELVRS